MLTLKYAIYVLLFIPISSKLQCFAMQNFESKLFPGRVKDWVLRVTVAGVSVWHSQAACVTCWLSYFLVGSQAVTRGAGSLRWKSTE